jgi:hypothetical protein
VPLTGLGVQRAETPVVVCLEWAHAQRVDQGQGFTVGSFGQFGLRGLALCVDLAEEPQSPRLLPLLLASP